jgi:hypothetical protein
MKEIVMTNAEKAEKIKAPIEDINEFSKELSEEDLKAVAGGAAKPLKLKRISGDGKNLDGSETKELFS